jgi:predicted nucleic acid-binding protein
VIHLDTSFLIRALSSGSPEDASLRRWLRAGEPLAMSTIAWAEFLCGPLSEEDRSLAAAVVTERVPFAEDDARLAARLFNESGQRRGSLGDCMVAASALNARASLATANPRDFRRLASAGLVLVEA